MEQKTNLQMAAEQKVKPSMEDFTQLRLLGRGSYGEVYLVEKKDTKMVYALKTMDKVHMAREKKQHHVYVEREVLSSFKSPWIIELHNCFQDKARLYFLLENVRNGELAEYLKVHRKLFSFRKARFRPGTFPNC
jgi:serine/threonine protein kinase